MIMPHIILIFYMALSQLTDLKGPAHVDRSTRLTTKPNVRTTKYLLRRACCSSAIRQQLLAGRCAVWCGSGAGSLRRQVVGRGRPLLPHFKLRSPGGRRISLALLGSTALTAVSNYVSCGIRKQCLSHVATHEYIQDE